MELPSLRVLSEAHTNTYSKSRSLYPAEYSSKVVTSVLYRTELKGRDLCTLMLVRVEVMEVAPLLLARTAW